MIFRILYLSMLTVVAFGQKDTMVKISFDIYGEIYYSYDFSRPQTNEKPDFIYNHKRHNEVNVNLLMAKAMLERSKMRSNLGVMAGGYSQYNLSNEPDWAKLIYEANLGIRLKNNWWIDAGIMPSHIGFESAIGADCWTLTRSILAENSPYFETGVKLSYDTENKKIYLAGLILNGWQNIQRINNVDKPSFGIQAVIRPTTNTTLNYSNFMGDVSSNNFVAFRHFHNFYLMHWLSKRTGILFGFDLGYQKEKDIYYNWYSPVIIIKHKINDRLNAAFRAEHFNDQHNIIHNFGTNTKFIVSGISCNTDYEINERMYFRFEVKNYTSPEKIFSNNTKRQNPGVTASITFKL